MISFEDLHVKYVPEAVKLALSEYEQERAVCPQLMDIDFEEKLTGMITYFFKETLGKVALEDGKVIGYLAFSGPWDGFFGKVKGVFSPLGANAFGGKNRNKLASMLFAEVAKDLLEKEVFSYGISRYAHDKEVGESFVMNGFGIRCSDAIMDVNLYYQNIDSQKHEIKTYKLSKDAVEETTAIEENTKLHETLQFDILTTPDEKRKIKPLFRQLVLHLLEAPTFFPDDVTTHETWFEREDIFVVAAKINDTYVGYLAVTREDQETFVTEENNMANICGAFVEEAYRQKGVAKQLVDYVVTWCKNNGFSYLGVDCETLNPTALRFWRKYFDNYTYSYVRRIDERCYGIRPWMDQVWNEADQNQKKKAK